MVEGPRAVDAALDRGAQLESVFLGPRAEVAFPALCARLDASGVDVVALKEGVLEKVGSTRTPQPVLAVASMPTTGGDVLGADGLVVVCVALSDPGNLGTLVRSAEASGAAAILLGPGSVDAYNPKTVRASAGACFAVEIVEGVPAVEALEALGSAGVQRVGALTRGGTAPEAIDLTRPTALVLGHEVHGLAADLPLDARVSVPMHGAESLNVAMAGTVLLFEAARQRRAPT